MKIIETTIKENLNLEAKPSFLLVLLSGVDKYIYPNMKRLGDVLLGIHTVHMQLRKARAAPHKQDQYFSNVALKVNIKLGGINHLLDDASMKWLKTKKTMIVGIGKWSHLDSCRTHSGRTEMVFRRCHASVSEESPRNAVLACRCCEHR